MSISLQKGQKISLSKDTVGEALESLVVGLGWDAAQKKGLFSKVKAIDCDASAFLLTDGKIEANTDVIYFKNLRHPTYAVAHMGDNLTGSGDGDDEQIKVGLGGIPPQYDRLVFVVNIYQAVERSQHFGMIQNAYIRLVNEQNGQEICKYNLSDDYVDMTSLIMGELYRHNGEWKFNAMGQGTTDAGLIELIRKYQ